MGEETKGRKECQFPFEYEGVTYNKCAPVSLFSSGPTLGISWCATDNTPKPENNGTFTNWGVCKKSRCCLGECAENCKWTVWSSWTECTESCEGGTTTRDRGYEVEAKHGGSPCQGDATESKECNTQNCPVHCEWDNWSKWTTCNQSCGGGMKTRERDVKVEAAHGGTKCQGIKKQSVACNTQPCPVNCSWGSWSSWSSSCSVGGTRNCGKGTIARTRPEIKERYGGKPCQGSKEEKISCSTTSCPSPTNIQYNGNWGDWGSLQYCGGQKYKGYAVQFRAQIEGKQVGDDTATNYLSLRCKDGNSWKGIASPTTWGSWNYHDCPSGYVIFGLSTRVERKRGWRTDDTALNGVWFKCC